MRIDQFGLVEECFKKIPRKFALKDKKMLVFGLIFPPSFPF